MTIDLRSKLLKIADLGPIIGLETKDSKKSSASHGTRPKASETGNRPAAQKKERETAGAKTLPSGTSARKGDGILPSGKFEGGRLRAIDADVTYRADSLKAPAALPVESMRFKFSLHDAVANLNPLEFGFAGGAIVGRVMMDARDEKRLVSTLDVDFTRLKLAQITPDSKLFAQGGGTLGGTVRLKAVGDSIADAAGNADGQLAAAIANGRISNLADAAAGLNGGKVLALLAGGDKNIKVNCGAIAFAVKDGLGSSQMITMDTEQTVVEGQGAFSLKDEKFDVRVEAKPKRPGILSLRTPVHAFGSFRSPEFELEKTPLLARGGAALALAAINPIASVIALLEPGTDDIASCQNPSSSVAAAQRQAQGPTTPKR